MKYAECRRRIEEEKGQSKGGGSRERGEESRK